jgi:hypothetical protein
VDIQQRVGTPQGKLSLLLQVLTEQKNYLVAAEFLQNIVFINLQMNDEEKIQRYLLLPGLPIGRDRQYGKI